MATDKNPSGIPHKMRYIFGIIMIIVYIGVGVLFFTGFFEPVYGQWTWVRWVGGGMFTVYGIWRAYRQFSGVDAEIGDSY